jgi:hypothetical protein
MAPQQREANVVEGLMPFTRWTSTVSRIGHNRHDALRSAPMFYDRHIVSALMSEVPPFLVL